MISATLGFGLLLSMIATGQSKATAILRARVAPPWSGETTQISSKFLFLK